MDIQQHINDLRRQSKELKHLIDEELPRIVGKEAVEHFQESFENEGFTDTVLVPWKDVKRRQNPRRTDRASASRKILTGDTGDLGNSIDFVSSPGEVVISSDKEYAEAHNEGTSNAGRNRGTTIPKRQFIGDSVQLDETIKSIAEDKLKSIQKSRS